MVLVLSAESVSASAITRQSSMHDEDALRNGGGNVPTILIGVATARAARERRVMIENCILI